MCLAGMSSQLLSVAVNSRLQHVCVGRSTADDILCYNSSGSLISSLSTAGVGVFAVTYDFVSGSDNALPVTVTQLMSLHDPGWKNVGLFRSVLLRSVKH